MTNLPAPADTTADQPQPAADPTTPVPTAAQIAARNAADGFRALADFIETHASDPNLHQGLSHLTRSKQMICLPVSGQADVIPAFAVAGARAGLKVVKDYSGDQYAGVDLHFGPVYLSVYAPRGEVCERVVVGTREVTEEVPDPDALAAVPRVTVTKTVEDVQWVCKPLLGDATGGVA